MQRFFGGDIFGKKKGSNLAPYINSASGTMASTSLMRARLIDPKVLQTFERAGKSKSLFRSNTTVIYIHARRYG